jgi:hypothetical protein
MLDVGWIDDPIPSAKHIVGCRLIQFAFLIVPFCEYEIRFSVLSPLVVERASENCAEADLVVGGSSILFSDVYSQFASQFSCGLN